MFVVKKKLALTPQEKPLLATNMRIMKEKEWPFYSMSDVDPAVLLPLSTKRIRVEEQNFASWEGSLRTMVFLARTTQLFCMILFVV